MTTTTGTATELTGSPKQIEWATRIRDGLLAQVEHIVSTMATQCWPKDQGGTVMTLMGLMSDKTRGKWVVARPQWYVNRDGVESCRGWDGSTVVGRGATPRAALRRAEPKVHALATYDLFDAAETRYMFTETDIPGCWEIYPWRWPG